MRSDALFRIASQTKALTSVGIMQLIEAGQLSLDDPVSRWIPGYARTVVASRTDSTAAPTPAARPITIRMLLTHTAGLSYGTEPTIAGTPPPTSDHVPGTGGTPPTSASRSVPPSIGCRHCHSSPSPASATCTATTPMCWVA
jgi:CubicO group peptidase (beta-lactamase class C family)